MEIRGILDPCDLCDRHLVEVDEIDKELVADGADEAGRVPAAVGPGARRGHADVAAIDVAGTLQTSSEVVSQGERAGIF
jgi:hypothetical protein